MLTTALHTPTLNRPYPTPLPNQAYGPPTNPYPVDMTRQAKHTPTKSMSSSAHSPTRSRWCCPHTPPQTHHTPLPNQPPLSYPQGQPGHSLKTPTQCRSSVSPTASPTLTMNQHYPISLPNQAQCLPTNPYLVDMTSLGNHTPTQSKSSSADSPTRSR